MKKLKKYLADKMFTLDCYDEENLTDDEKLVCAAGQLIFWAIVFTLGTFLVMIFL